jgi:hypothetical protein
MASYRGKKSILLIFIITLCLIEVISRILIRNDWLLKSTSQLSSTRWRLIWMKTHLPQTTSTLSFDSYHSLLGWYPLKNATNVTNEKAVVNFNSDGIRGKQVLGIEKTIDTTRIVVVGDSFSFGEGVNDDETYPAKLEKMLPNTEVLNLAVHGYGIDQMTLRLNLDGFSYHPDYVIYAFIEDDLRRAVLSFRDYMKPRYELVDGNLMLTNTPVIPPDEFFRQSRYRPAILDLISLLRDRITYKNNEDPTIGSLVQAIWKKTVTDIQDHDAIPVFLYLPSGRETMTPDTTLSSSERDLFSFCSETGISCFSARTYLTDAYKLGMKYRPSTHYEPIIHTIIAKGLAEDLKKTFDTTWRL